MVQHCWPTTLRARASWRDGSKAWRMHWPGVTLRGLTDAPRELARAGRLQLRVAVALNGLTPADVRR